MRLRHGRTRGLRRGDWIALVAILAVAASAPAFLLFQPNRRPNPEQPVANAGPVPPTPKADIRVVAAPPATRYVLQPPFDVEDALTFGPEKAARTRLVDLEGPQAESVCLDKDGRPWACGLAARAALYNAIRLRPIECEPVRLTAGLQLSRCSSDKGDLGRQMVAQGFARPPNGIDTPELSAAREAGLGLWNGGWRLRR